MKLEIIDWLWAWSVEQYGTINPPPEAVAVAVLELTMGIRVNVKCTR